MPAARHGRLCWRWAPSATATKPICSKAFVCGFEVGASLGSQGVGVKLNESGWHSTAVLGRVSSASAAAYLMTLASDAIEDALGLAATQAGPDGFFRHHGKTVPRGKGGDGRHHRRAARGRRADRVACAARLLEGPVWHDLQDRQTIPDLNQLGKFPEIMQNSLKPYAACQLAHAPIDAALLLRDKIETSRSRSIVIDVNPLAVEIAAVQNARKR